MKLSISKSKNSESLYIQKSIRKNGSVTTKTVKKLGTMAALLPEHNNSRDEVIKWAKALAVSMTEDEKMDQDSVIISLSQSRLIPHDSRVLFNGASLFLQKIFSDLHLDSLCDSISDRYSIKYSLKDILASLIYTRLIFPSSKRSSYEDAKKFIVQPSFALHDVYRSLDILAENSDEIQQHLYENSLKLVKRNTNILYYDCTNYFFEIEEERDNCKYGKSKEHRPNPIISMGLLMDGDGFPLSFVMFPGNQNEQPTLIPLEKRVMKDFKLSKFVICTDSGLASADNRKFNMKGQRAYIVTQSLKKVKKHIKEWALNPNGWSLYSQLDLERKNSDFKSVKIDISNVLENIDNADQIDSATYNSIWYKERWINENGISQRIIVSFSPKYRAYQRKVRSGQVERAKKQIESNIDKANKNPNSPDRFKSQLYFTNEGEIAEESIISFDEDKLKNEEQYDGFYAVCTTLEDNIEDIIRVNKRRWEIEESFKIIKSEFKARPVFLHKDNRIKAHFLTCFISLMFLRILEAKTDHRYTVEELLKCLKEYNLHHVEGSGYIPVYIRTELTDKLHEISGFRTDYQIVSEKNMKKIIKKVSK